ncbi:MAG: divergent polysaccharide deacetylase family protein [Nitrospirota bacterium]
MAPKKKRRKHHIAFILLFIIAAVFFYVEEFHKEKIPGGIMDIFRPGRKPAPPPSEEAGTPRRTALPKIAIVIDDLGPNKQTAEEVLKLNAPLTLSILPQQDYSAWIAKEGDRLGHDIMLHLPMEAERPLRLGKGGLYTWMTEAEISRTIEDDIRSVPHIKGVNNHMGSLLTRDERVMKTVMSELKSRRLFFLDSLTTPETAGFRLARAVGLRTARRNIFLDDSDDLRDIGVQWDKLIKEAKQRGHAIALGHPKKNTLAFLQKALRDNKEVTIVPVTELID